MRAALVLGVAYVLSRRGNVRLATVVAAAAASGGVGGMAVKRAAKVFGSTGAVGSAARLRRAGAEAAGAEVAGGNGQ